ncbi:MAG: shikimate dehydrogenase [Alphaproteobacteria bacterium]|nr:shikimate dehydrogenase [Alphaproteobacteria bacterium]
MKLGLIGKEISHSLSPFIHKYWLKKYQLPGSYEFYPLETVNKENILSSGFEGVNVTMPFKREVVAFLNEKDDLVQRIKAVNTLLIENGSLKGTNTDATGFKRLIQPNLPLKSAVVLGSGGAALSSIWALSESGVRDIRVVARNKKLCFDSSALTVYLWSEMNEVATDCDIFINATPLGMNGGFDLLVLPTLPPYCLVVDWVYYPYMTLLLTQAKKRNLQVIDGLDLLLAQAQDAFYFWFGIYPETTTELRQELCRLLD